MYIKVRVFAGAKKESVTEVGENRLEISVKQKAQRNLANSRVKELVAEYAQVPAESVHLINGHMSPSKMFSIRNAPQN